VHAIVDNHGGLENSATTEIVELIEFLAQTRKAFIEVLELPQEQHRGRLIRVATQRVKFFNGVEKNFEFAERSPRVRILATDGNQILLTKEWRSETGNWDYRLPGGKVFDSLNEYLNAKDEPNFDMNQKAAAAARKELEEETSLDIVPEAFSTLHHSVCGATVIWDLHYYLAQVSEANIAVRPTSIVTDEGEHTHPEWFTAEEVKTLCLKGAVQEDRTAAVLLRYILAKNSDK